MNKVSVSIPASTANLGPGFDCLALALDLHNTIQVELKGEGIEVHIEGEGSDQLPRDSSNLCLQAFIKLFEISGAALPGMIVRLHNRIPLSSGMGSSSAAIIGGLLAADAILGLTSSPSQILKMVRDLENHLDNAAASLLGGFVAVMMEGDEILTQKIPIPVLSLVIILPHTSISTAQMRQVLPPQITHQDAVYNLSHYAFTIEALREGNYERLGKAMKDKLHQPYRVPLIPGYREAEKAALDAGASAVTLSGAGPAMVAFAQENHAAIAEAMQGAFSSLGLDAQQFIVPVNHTGATVRLI